MASLVDVAHSLQTVFTSTADNAARATRFIQRDSKITGPLFAQTLVFGWLAKPEATLEELAQTARTLGLAVTPQALDQRFTPQAADFLHDVLQAAVHRVVAADPVAVPLLQRFRGGVHLLDSTTISLPDALAPVWAGCGGTGERDGLAAVKLHVRFDVLQGTLRGPVLSPARVPDQCGLWHSEPLPPEALRLADLGYFSLDTFQQLSQQRVYWLTRFQDNTKLFDTAGRGWTLTAFLAQHRESTVDVPVTLGVEHRLPCRLLAVRVPAAVAEKRRQRLRKKAARKGKKVHPERMALADWNVFVTNVPESLMNIQEALVLARCRWQIELLFKLWKSEGRIDESRSAKPWRILCEVYAKLLGMVVQHWILLLSCWSYADRSLRKASRTVRAHASALGIVLSQGQMVIGILATIQRCLEKGCRINKRRKEPSAYQLQFDPTEYRQTG